MNTSTQGTHETLKITAQDFYGLHAPSECALRVYLRAKGELETEPGAFEQVLMRLGRATRQTISPRSRRWLICDLWRWMRGLNEPCRF
jgi:hypothetical protein